MAIQRRQQNHSNPFIGAPQKTVKLHWKPVDALTDTASHETVVASPVKENNQSVNIALLVAFLIFVGTVGLASVWYFVR